MFYKAINTLYFSVIYVSARLSISKGPKLVPPVTFSFMIVREIWKSASGIGSCKQRAGWSKCNSPSLLFEIQKEIKQTHAASSTPTINGLYSGDFAFLPFVPEQQPASGVLSILSLAHGGISSTVHKSPLPRALSVHCPRGSRNQFPRSSLGPSMGRDSFDS